MKKYDANTVFLVLAIANPLTWGFALAILACAIVVAILAVALVTYVAIAHLLYRALRRQLFPNRRSCLRPAPAQPLLGVPAAAYERNDSDGYIFKRSLKSSAFTRNRTNGTRTRPS